MDKDLHVDGGVEEGSSNVVAADDEDGTDLRGAGNLGLEPLVLEDRERVDTLVRKDRVAL